MGCAGSKKKSPSEEWHATPISNRGQTLHPANTSLRSDVIAPDARQRDVSAFQPLSSSLSHTIVGGEENHDADAKGCALIASPGVRQNDNTNVPRALQSSVDRSDPTSGSSTTINDEPQSYAKATLEIATQQSPLLPSSKSNLQSASDDSSPQSISTDPQTRPDCTSLPQSSMQSSANANVTIASAPANHNNPSDTSTVTTHAQAALPSPYSLSQTGSATHRPISTASTTSSASAPVAAFAQSSATTQPPPPHTNNIKSLGMPSSSSSISSHANVASSGGAVRSVQSAKPAKRNVVGQVFIAVYPYAGDQGDLCFAKGEELIILDNEDGDWYAVCV